MGTHNNIGTGEMRLEEGGAGSNSRFEGGGGYSMNTEMDPNGTSRALLSAAICSSGMETSYTVAVVVASH